MKDRNPARFAEILPVKKLIRAVILTDAGFLIAIIGNFFIPQVAKGLKISDYDLFGLMTVNLNGFYRVVLTGVIIIFSVAGFLVVAQNDFLS